jgi:chaperonin GroEL
MPVIARILTVLIASPGDVISARDAIERELHEWNAVNSVGTKITLQPRRWETDGVPLFGRGDVQSVLNRQVVEQSDIVIAVFHTRLGSPTPRAASGTAEEIELASAAGKLVHVWFSEEPVPYDVDPDQLRILQTFRKVMESKHYVGSFRSQSELLSEIRKAIGHDVHILPRSADVPDGPGPRRRPIRAGSLEQYFNAADGISTLAARVGRIIGPSTKNRADLPDIVESLTHDSVDQQVGFDLIRNLVLETRRECSDGSATASVLAGGIVERTVSAIQYGEDPQVLRRDLRSGLREISSEIRDMSVEVESVAQIAAAVCAMTGRNDYGEVVGSALNMVGAKGRIVVEAGISEAPVLHCEEAVHVDGRYASTRFARSQFEEIVVDNPYVVVVNSMISSFADVLPLLEAAVKVDRAVAIFALGVEGSALDGLVLNAIGRKVEVVAVVPNDLKRYGETLLGDVAVATGAEVISGSLGLSLRSFDWWLAGQATRIVVSGDATKIIGGGGDNEQIANRIRVLESQLQNASSDDDRALLEMRMGSLAGGIATIQIGLSDSDDSRRDIRLVRRAVATTRIAVESGLVPGGGWSYVIAQRTMRQRHGRPGAGLSAIIDALHLPTSRILSNTGNDASAILVRMQGQLQDGIVFDGIRRSEIRAQPSGLVDACGVQLACVSKAVALAERHLDFVT